MATNTYFSLILQALRAIERPRPLSRLFMESLVSPEGGAADDLNAREMFSNKNFPFTVKEVAIGYARVPCSYYLPRELGYELYIPTEQALHVYDRIMDLKQTALSGGEDGTSS